MPLFHLVILALIQGITEFLPISSSGHLVLTHAALGHGESMTDAQEKIFDIAVHIGTLGAVCLYFHKDLMNMILGGIDILRFRDSAARHKALLIICASLPVIVVGFVINFFGASMFDHLVVIGWTTLIFGVVLWVIDRKMPQTLSFDEIGFRHAFLIGISQILALIPGTSRSGITMISARALGYSRVDAARFSMLLGIVAISGAGTLAGLDVFQIDDAAFTSSLIWAALFSFISAFIAIALMMKWLAKFSFAPFAIYRIILGVGLLALFYSGLIS
jgi:undecaprenyl-diphosphatase